MLKKEPKILVCPLNWGLGHATRTVPIVEQLNMQDFEVWIAASGDSLILLKKQFPKLNYIDFPNCKVKYSTSNSQVFSFLMAIPKIIFGTVKEHFQIKKIVKDYNFNIVISDNRYGLWNRFAYNVFITHQLNIKLPNRLKFFEPILKTFVRRFINKYDECWIPDFKGENSIAGELAYPSILKNLYYIGLLSRYKNEKESEEKEIEVLFILSGPEPQRTVFEDLICEQIGNRKQGFVLVRGTTKERKQSYSFPVFDLLDSKELLSLMNKAEIIICRSGYSTIMDLIALNKKAFLVPTPGQTEQEYLAESLKNKGLFNAAKQSEFNIDIAKQSVYKFFDNKRYVADNVLNERILLLKEKQNN
ncbi:MAG: hypothetical protein KAR57_00290 [Bacteroidales bacterium]|nr:hypothetical protein [Bacteroidales bacterium]